MAEKMTANDLVGDALACIEHGKDVAQDAGADLTAAENIAYAQVLATLALVEQQRLANVIALEKARREARPSESLTSVERLADINALHNLRFQVGL